MSPADNHGQRFMKGRGSYARPALENRGGFLLLSARLSALARRFAAIVAVLAMVGAFAAGATALAPTRATRIGTSFPVHTEFTPSDPFFIDQWGLKSIGVPTAWDVTLGDKSVIVAVVDTGVWWTQPDIQANMWTNSADGTHGYDFVDGDTNPMDIDPSGTYHGTGVAGVIGAITDNTVEIAGTAQVSIMAVRALGSNGQGSSTDTAQAIIWAADHGAKVINLSLGTNETPPVEPTDIHLAIDHAWSKGALIVAAAGNAGVGTLDYPARLPEVVSVAAIDESGQRASFSNYGTGLDLSAPGTRIDTLNGGNNQLNNVHSLQGTSFSTPFVSGIAGLLLSAEPGLTNVQLWNILNMTAVQPVGSGYNKDYGWGVVSARNAIAALNQPLISVDSYPTSVSSSSTFGVTWSILGPAGMAVSDTHLVWGTSSGALGNATAAQSGQTRQSYTAGGLALPSGAGALYFKVVTTVNGTAFSSREYTVIASSVPDFLYVLYQLLASNLLYLALFILVLAGVVAFIPQRRAARARRSVARPQMLYPPSYYVQAAQPSQPPPVAYSAQTVTPRIEPQISGPPTPTQTPTVVQPVAPVTVAQPTASKKRCPSCGTMVSAENMFCFFCGNRFR